MKILFKRPTIYMSHPIRGQNNDIEGNCRKAAAAARRLRRVFPEIDFYIPAEHDLTMQSLVLDGRISISDVLYADLEILRACHGWMYYKHQESGGSLIEAEEAHKRGLIFDIDEQTLLYDIEKISYEKLRRDFSLLIEETKKRFRKGKKNEDQQNR